MIPYTDFAYWGLLLYPTLPTFVVAWSRRLRQGWILLATLGVLVVQYNAERVFGPHLAVREIWLVLGYAALQYGVALSLLWSRPRTGARWPFYVAVLLGLAPLVDARLAPRLAPTYQVGFLGLSYVTFRSVDVLVGILGPPDHQAFTWRVRWLRAVLSDHLRRPRRPVSSVSR